jgi:hypothetical protein
MRNRIWYVRFMAVLIGVAMGVPTLVVFALTLRWGSMPFHYVFSCIVYQTPWLVVPFIKFLVPNNPKSKAAAVVTTEIKTDTAVVQEAII